MRAWIVRSGKSGEREQWALDKGCTGGGFGEVENLTGAETRELVSAALERAYPAATGAAIRTFTSQLWALRSVMSKNDLVVMPLKSSPELAIGRIEDDYEDFDESDPRRRHVRPVSWIVSDLPRAAIKQDLLLRERRSP
jgi:restriction system protein